MHICTCDVEYVSLGSFEDGAHLPHTNVANKPFVLSSVNYMYLTISLLFLLTFIQPHLPNPLRLQHEHRNRMKRLLNLQLNLYISSQEWSIT